MQHNGSVLAYMGDAVLSLQVREYLILKGLTRPSDLLKASTYFVSAMHQAEFMDWLLKQNLLEDEEMVIYRRGLNYKNRSFAKNADLTSYRKATGLEALWGYWFLNQQHDRLRQMWDNYRTVVEEKYGTIYLRQE